MSSLPNLGQFIKLTGTYPRKVIILLITCAKTLKEITHKSMQNVELGGGVYKVAIS